MAKRMISVKPTIDIATNNDQAFRSACEYNKMDIVEWFHEMNPCKYNYRVNETAVLSWEHIVPVISYQLLRVQSLQITDEE